MGVHEKARKLIDLYSFPEKWRSRSNKISLTLSRSISKTSIAAALGAGQNTNVQSTIRLPKINKSITVKNGRSSRFKN